MRLNFYLTIFLTVLLPVYTYSANKSDRLRPQWITKQIPESNNSTYFFLDAQGSGQSLDAARQSAIANLTTRLLTERGIKVNTALQTKSRTTTMSNYNEKNGINKKYQYQEVEDFDMEVIEENAPTKINCKTVDEYWAKNNGVYTINILYCIADKIGCTKIHDAIYTTTSYPYAGFLSIIPGAGQMYKGDYAKGASFLVFSIAGATSIVLCESTRSSYAAKMKQQPKYAQEYSTLANNWEIGRNICIGVTACIWVWNLVDAFVAKGAKRVIVSSKYGNFSIAPSFQFDNYTQHVQAGFGISYNIK